MIKINIKISVLYGIIIVSFLFSGSLRSCTNHSELKHFSEEKVNLIQNNDLNMAIYSADIITERADDFLDGTMDNLTVNEEGTLLLDRNLWKDITASGSKPPPLSITGGRMVYDVWNGIVILFGYSDDTWTYDYSTNTWTQMSPSNSPVSRGGTSMIYDIDSEKVILFGGMNSSHSLNDTWAYDYLTDTWTQMNPPVAPSVRHDCAIAYDRSSKKNVLFGGGDWTTGNIYGDTWIYDYSDNNWTQMNPTTTPRARVYHSLVYNSNYEGVMLFGGESEIGYPDDFWVYYTSANIWVQIYSSTPSPRGQHSMVYTVSGNIILYGGKVSGSPADTYLADTWIFNSITYRWIQVDSNNTELGKRAQCRLIYEEWAQEVILFGGTDGLILHGDAWRYSETEFYRKGFLKSKITSFGHIFNISGSLSWNPSSQPANTDLKLQIGFSNTTSDNDFQYTPLNDSSFSFKGLAQYIRYQVNFESNPNQLSSPLLNDVFIEYSLEKPSPYIKISDPQDSSEVDGLVAITALANSSNGIEKVYFYINGVLSAIDYVTPFTYFWNSSTVDNGSVSVLAVAVSTLGRENTDSIQLLVNNSIDVEPQISIPGAPQSLSISTGNYQLQLNWSQPSSDGESAIIRYNIYRGIISGEFNLLGITTGTNFTDTSVTGGITYFYIVTATNAIGEGSFSNEVSSTPSGILEPTDTVPSAPQGLITNVGDNFVALSWSTPINDGGSPITSYRVYRGTESGEYFLIGATITTNFNDTLVQANNTYYYVMTALNANGESGFSVEVSANLTGITVPQSGTLPSVFSFLLFLGILVLITRKYKRI